MNRIVVQSRVGGDGILHLDVPVGAGEAGQEVQITVEPASNGPYSTAADWLHSGLVGLWADRTDIDDSRAYARCLREQAQNRRPGA